MNALVIANRGIRTDAEGRVSLNDCHHAAGGEPRHRPSRWLANVQTKALIAEMETAGIPAVKASEGRGGGTFAAQQLVIAYAAWIDPKFHLQVVNTFLAAKVAVPAAPSPMQDLQAALNDPATLRGLLLDHADARLALERQVDALAPRAAALDRLMSSGKTLSLTEAAKFLQVSPRAFMTWLATIGWTYRSGGFGDWQAHQRRIDAGDMRHVMLEIDHYGVMQVKAQAKVTAKGLARLAKLLEMPNAPPIAA